jgi:tRNA dimethylallyltransferase
LTEGLFEGPDGDAGLRSSLREEARVYGVHHLHQRLQEVDPEAARRIHPHDLVRIVRALEVYILTGIPISYHQRRHGFSSRRYHVLYLGVAMERTVLKGRIHRRVDRMIQEGLLEEVKGLMEMGYGPDLPSMQSLGYRHVGRYLQGLWSLQEAVEKMKRDTCRFARRQMTWFRSVDGVVWFPPDRCEEMILRVEKFYESNSGSLDIFPKGCYKKKDKMKFKYP